MDDEKQLGINIRELRKLKLLTQAEQAERAGFSLQHVGDIERGKANPTLSCLLKLAGVLNVTVSDFFHPRNKLHLVMKKLDNVCWISLEKLERSISLFSTRYTKRCGRF